MSYVTDMARSVVRYDPSHRQALREFQRAHFGEGMHQCDDAFAEWLFERNPHRDPQGASRWLCIRDGVVIGQQASIPVLLKVHDLQYRAAFMIDWRVHKDWHLKGVAPALFAAFSQASEIMLGLGVEDVPYRNFVRAGWKDMGRLALFVRPFDPQACAQGLSAPKALTRLAPRAIVGGSARMLGRVSALTRRVKLEPIAAFDERVNGVWSAASRQHPILVKRDFEALRWRYDESPHQPLYQRYYLMHAGAVVGYAVIRLEQWYEHTIGRIVDYLTEHKWLSPLFALAFEAVYAQGTVAAFIENHDPEIARVLKPLGCIRARDAHRFMLNTRDRAAPLLDTLAHREHWFLTAGDGDYDHVMIDG